MELLDFTENRDLLRSTFALFPSGVAALSAVVDGRPLVFVASSFQVGISADPPLVLFAVQRTSRSWPLLKTAPRIGVSVLGEVHDAAARQMASKADDRFEGIATTTLDNGAHFVQGAPVWFETSVHSEFPAGDHDVVLLQVHALGTEPGAEPLVFQSSTFRSLAPRPALA